MADAEKTMRTKNVKVVFSQEDARKQILPEADCYVIVEGCLEKGRIPRRVAFLSVYPNPNLEFERLIKAEIEEIDAELRKVPASDILTIYMALMHHLDAIEGIFLAHGIVEGRSLEFVIAGKGLEN